MPKATIGQKVVRTAFAAVIAVVAIVWLLVPHSAGASQSSAASVKVVTNLQKFVLHARCARLAERAGTKLLFAEHVKIAREYKGILGDNGSIAYEVGYIDGGLDRIHSYNKGKFSVKAIAKQLYENFCPSNA